MKTKSLKSWSKKIVKTLKETPLLKPSDLFKILDPKEKAGGLVEDALRDLVASGAVILNSNRKLHVSEKKLSQKPARDHLIKMVYKHPNTALSKICEKLTKKYNYSKIEVAQSLRKLIADGDINVDGTWRLSLAKNKRGSF